MIILINTLCRAIPSSYTLTKRNYHIIHKLFYLFKYKQMYRPVTLVVPCAALIPKPLSFSVNQNEVEENITHLMTLARIALEKGDVEKAEAILEMGIKISAEYQSYLAMPYMYDILASVAFAKGNLKKAELLLVRVIEELIQLGAEENDSQIIDFKLRLARIYSSYEEKELAEIGFKTCLADQEAKIIKGDITTKTGLLYVNILFWYGMHQLQNANYKKAKQLIDLAYNHSLNIKGLTPYQEMIILYTMADLNIKLQSYDVAFQNIQSAIFLGKGIGSVDLPKFYLKLAAIYMKIGAKDKAEHWLNEAYSLAELFNDREVSEQAERMLTELN